MKYLEESLDNLSFGTLANLTVARFNKIDEHLELWTDEQMNEYHQKQQQYRNEQLNTANCQAEFRQQAEVQKLTDVCPQKNLKLILILI